jgi:hypothetical protein
MATAAEELTTLKMRAAKHQGGENLTLIDHTANTRQACTVAEGVGHLARLVEKGAGHHSIHIVDLREEKQRKLTNPKKSTKRLINCRTPEQWTELNAALEPFYEVAVDPHVAIDLIVRALASVTRATIASWLQEGSEAPPGPEPAVVPGDEWFAEHPDAQAADELPEFLKD